MTNIFVKKRINIDIQNNEFFKLVVIGHNNSNNIYNICTILTDD